MLEKGFSEVLCEEQTTREKEFLRSQAAKAKEERNAQRNAFGILFDSRQVATGRWDQHLRAQEIAAEQDFQKALAQLHESSRQMRLKLEEQANQLLVEYQARRSQEEINRHKHEVQLHLW